LPVSRTPPGAGTVPGADDGGRRWGTVLLAASLLAAPAGPWITPFVSWVACGAGLGLAATRAKAAAMGALGVLGFAILIGILDSPSEMSVMFGLFAANLATAAFVLLGGVPGTGALPKVAAGLVLFGAVANAGNLLAAGALGRALDAFYLGPLLGGSVLLAAVLLYRAVPRPASPA
jgi:hypothetical protein